MSVEAMLAVHKLAVRTSHACYRVLMTVAEHVNAKHGGKCSASIKTIAREAQMDPKTVRQSLAKLQELGLLVPAGEKPCGRGNIAVWALGFLVTRLKETVTQADDAAQAPIETSIETLAKGGLTPPTTAAQSGVEPACGPIKGGLAPPEPVLNLQSGSKEGAPPSAAPPARPDPKGTRLPDDWTPSELDRAYAAKQGLDADAVAEKFSNHWLSKAGKDARKASWSAAFRVWCQRDAEWARERARAAPRGENAAAERRRVLGPSMFEARLSFDAHLDQVSGMGGIEHGRA